MIKSNVPIVPTVQHIWSVTLPLVAVYRDLVTCVTTSTLDLECHTASGGRLPQLGHMCDNQQFGQLAFKTDF